MKFKNQTTIIFFILCLLILSDICLRLIQDKISGDIRHINSIEETLRNLTNEESTRILFLGNSLIGDGINISEFKSIYKQNGNGPIAVSKVVPDGTNLMDWYYIVKNKIINKKNELDMLILGFGWNQLEDHHVIFPIRLGAHFCKLSDIPELLEFGLTDFGDQVEFVIAKASSVFANRATIRNQTLDMWIPHYQDQTQRINDLQKEIKKKSNKQKFETSYIRLERFLDILSKRKMRVVIIAMPILEVYRIDPEIKKIIEKYGMKFLDCRDIPGITNNNFVDSMHLEDQGSKIFSRYLASKIITTKSDILHK
jgi:hypothetical protein